MRETTVEREGLARGAKLSTKWTPVIVTLFALLTVAACGTEAEEQGLPDQQALATPATGQVAAVDAAVASARGNGLLVSESTSAFARALAVENAFDELAKWGMANPGDSVARPSAGKSVWLVTIVGYGVIPRPPDIERFEECLETKVIINAESKEVVFMTAKPSKDC